MKSYLKNLFYILLIPVYTLAAPIGELDPTNDWGYLPFEIGFSKNISDLPYQGKSLTPVWVGDYFPLNKGGTTKAMRKLEEVSPLSRGALNWERQSVEESKRIRWSGHCNGLAAAGINEREPQKSVEYKGVHFSVNDIKALLVELWQGSGVNELIGAGCSSKGRKKDNFGRYREKECQDVNAGTFHIFLSNFLGLNGLPFIADFSANYEVWNYAIKEFRSEVIEINTKEALKKLGVKKLNNYLFNKYAVRFAFVKSEIFSSFGKKIKYEYILELDSTGQILGGEWVGKSKKNHPDFLWKPSILKTENPYINTEDVRNIVELSY